MKDFRLLIFIFVLIFSACSSKHQTIKPLSISSVIIKDDVLKIGLNPIPPVQNQENLKLLEGIDVSKLLGNLKSGYNPDDETNLISLMSSSAGVLTVWATKPGNWLWGYTPRDSISFRGARIWSIIILKDGSVMFKNYLHETCISAYNNGVIHLPCNENSPSQKWRLNKFANQAWQIKNEASNKCLQTPTFRKTTFYSIFLRSCADKNNLDQQWYITPPLMPTDALFTTN